MKPRFQYSHTNRQTIAETYNELLISLKIEGMRIIGKTELINEKGSTVAFIALKYADGSSEVRIIEFKKNVKVDEYVANIHSENSNVEFVNCPIGLLQLTESGKEKKNAWRLKVRKREQPKYVHSVKLVEGMVIRLNHRESYRYVRKHHMRSGWHIGENIKTGDLVELSSHVINRAMRSV